MNSRKLTPHLLLLLLLAGAAGAFFGCETTEGAGRDIENLGDEIEEEAEDNDGDND
jgi:predicted small secreted protein